VEVETLDSKEKAEIKATCIGLHSPAQPLTSLYAF